MTAEKRFDECIKHLFRCIDAATPHFAELCKSAHCDSCNGVTIALLAGFHLALAEEFSQNMSREHTEVFLAMVFKGKRLYQEMIAETPSNVH